MTNQMGMKDVNEEDVEEILQWHSEDLSNEDLQEIANQTILEKVVDNILEEEMPIKGLSTEYLSCSITTVTKINDQNY